AMLETGLPKFGVLNRLKTSVRNCRQNRSSIGDSLKSEKSKRVCAWQIHPVRSEGSASSRTPLGLPEILASSDCTETIGSVSCSARKGAQKKWCLSRAHLLGFAHDRSHLRPQSANRLWSESPVSMTAP